MYDKYPVYDVPQNNVVQRFFSQRWSAIVIEIALTIVITVAAGRAFDFFGPFEGESAAPALAVEARRGDPLEPVKERARHYIRDGRYAAAAALYDFVIMIEPAEAANTSWRGYISMQTGDFQAAQDYYRRLLALSPDGFDGHNSLCWAYGETGQFASALAHCSAALKAAQTVPAYAIALENRCWVLVEMGEYEAAAQDCLTVLEMNGGCAEEVCALAHYNLGRILAAQSQERGALREFRAAYEIGSSYSDMYLEIAAFYDRLGYRSAAEASYREYRRLSGGGMAGE